MGARRDHEAKRTRPRATKHTMQNAPGSHGGLHGHCRRYRGIWQSAIHVYARGVFVYLDERSGTQMKHRLFLIAALEPISASQEQWIRCSGDFLA